MTESQQELIAKIAVFLERFITTQEKQQEMYLNASVVVPKKFNGFSVYCVLHTLGISTTRCLLDARSVPNLESVGNVIAAHAFSLGEKERLVVTIGKEEET